MKHFAHLLSLAVVVALLLTACAQTPEPAPAEPTEAPAQPTEAAAEPTEPPVAEAAAVVIAIGGDPTTLDPQAADDGNERAVNDNIYETLLTRDHDMNIVPLLAESYEQID